MYVLSECHILSAYSVSTNNNKISINSVGYLPTLNALKASITLLFSVCLTPRETINKGAENGLQRV